MSEEEQKAKVMLDQIAQSIQKPLNQFVGDSTNNITWGLVKKEVDLFLLALLEKDQIFKEGMESAFRFVPKDLEKHQLGGTLIIDLARVGKPTLDYLEGLGLIQFTEVHAVNTNKEVEMNLSPYQKIDSIESTLAAELDSLMFDNFDAVHLVRVNGEWQIFLASTEDPSQDFRYGEGDSITESISEAKQHIEAEKAELNQE